MTRPARALPPQPAHLALEQSRPPQSASPPAPPRTCPAPPAAGGLGRAAACAACGTQAARRAETTEPCSWLQAAVHNKAIKARQAAGWAQAQPGLTDCEQRERRKHRPLAQQWRPRLELHQRCYTIDRRPAKPGTRKGRPCRPVPSGLTQVGRRTAQWHAGPAPPFRSQGEQSKSISAGCCMGCWCASATPDPLDRILQPL